MARFKKSFYDWCMENGKEEWLELWDYELNKCTPKEIGFGTKEKYFFKCNKGLHDSEQKRISDLTSGNTNFKCDCCNSIGQHLIDTYGEDALEKYWDYDKNGNLNPFEIPRRSNKKVWFKCDKGLHDSEQKIICNLTSVNTELKCNACNSIGQYLINNYGEDALEKYWDYDKNGNLNPFKISRGSDKKVWIKCDKGLHESELKRINDLTSGNTELKCNCCNSFAQCLIDTYGEDALEKYWDYDKNGNLNPFKISRGSDKKVWIKCQENEEHGSYDIICHNFTSNDSRCPICKEKHGERKIRDYLMKNNVEFTPQKTFPKLLGTGNKPLSYDFYIPSKNLLIEFQGIQHYKPTDFDGKGMEQAEKNFKNQQEHDRRKREYAKQNNIHLLEITYLEEDKIEEILDKIFK